MNSDLDCIYRMAAKESKEKAEAYGWILDIAMAAGVTTDRKIEDIHERLKDVSELIIKKQKLWLKGEAIPSGIASNNLAVDLQLLRYQNLNNQ